MPGDAAERARRLGSAAEDFPWILDALCGDLGLECDAFLPPGEVAARRPKALGRPASELVAELRRGRLDDIS